MPDHVHAIVFPQQGTTISEVLRRFKLATFQRLRLSGLRVTGFWQSCFYDHALRTRKEFDDALEYMHNNPARRGLVEEPAAWPWSSARWFVDETGPVPVDVMRLPFDSRARIWKGRGSPGLDPRYGFFPVFRVDAAALLNRLHRAQRQNSPAMVWDDHLLAGRDVAPLLMAAA